jgi:hypothetical protein
MAGFCTLREAKVVGIDCSKLTRCDAGKMLVEVDYGVGGWHYRADASSPANLEHGVIWQTCIMSSLVCSSRGTISVREVAVVCMTLPLFLSRAVCVVAAPTKQPPSNEPLSSKCWRKLFQCLAHHCPPSAGLSCVVMPLCLCKPSREQARRRIIQEAKERKASRVAACYT